MNSMKTNNQGIPPLKMRRESLSAADKRHEHEDSPEYAECRQQASRFISCDGDEDFLTSIYVYSHNL